ncbi:MAG: YgiQ family radical SAM protein, partial [Oscillospiraceae bacterium]|nr:YgiQ family radical SAM protein [Oscillospiraceae bacterium]
MSGFLPLSRKEMDKLGWPQPDFVYVIGDAYVDHPSFGHAIISRVLERAGYKVAICAQPDWKDPNSVTLFGTPRLGFLVSGGNMDSMVNHYSVSKHRRKTDAYTPGGVMGKRPDYATVVYCNLIRRSYPKIPIIIGGIEASLRRLAHYDYWSDKLKRSVLLDSQADLLLYGMGEKSIVEAADALNSGLAIEDLTFLRGTAYVTKNPDLDNAILLPSYDELCQSKRKYAQSFYLQYKNTDPYCAKRLIEPYGKEYVVQNLPQLPLTTQEMDE